MPAAPDPTDPTAGTAHHEQALDCGNDRELVIAIDTLVDGVHFPAGTAPEDLGYKALAVNLSDLAAMGADPRGARASLTHPREGEDDARAWLSAFEQGLDDLAQRFSVAMPPTLTTRGPLSVTVEALGTVPRGMALRRSGAAPGDRILVTGTLGDAGLALVADSADRATTTPDIDAWLQARLARPEPRVDAGIALRGLATAAIDVSDGLAADLGHILSASRVGARLTVDDLPLSSALLQKLPRERAWQLALSSGDDYELCFTVAADLAGQVERLLPSLGCGCAVIGTITAHTGLECLRADGSHFRPAPGYRHFQ
jgi:thiamine-monophosphate kinase